MQGSITRKKERIIGPARLCLLLLWPLAGLTLLLARHSEVFAEQVFAQGLYPLYHRVLSLLPECLSFSLGEMLLYAVSAFALIAGIAWCVHMIKGRDRRWRILLAGGINTLCALGLVFSLFVFGCGANYYRTSYAKAAGLEVTASTQEELYELCLALAHRAAALRQQLAACENAAGVFTLPCSNDALGQSAVEAMTALGQEEEMLDFRYPRPKSVLCSRGMSYFGITGIYSPFTGEANVNTDTSGYTIPAAMCHELCHTAGVMREDEANYLAYLACTRHGDTVLAYSGTMLALTYSANALHRAAPALYARAAEEFGEGVWRDFAANAAYWAQFEDTVTNGIGKQVNDTYLKANNQPTGTQSYGAMVDVLLAEYKTRNEMKN